MKVDVTVNNGFSRSCICRETKVQDLGVYWQSISHEGVTGQVKSDMHLVPWINQLLLGSLLVVQISLKKAL